MWFIGVEVEQETSAPPPKKNPRSARVNHPFHQIVNFIVILNIKYTPSEIAIKETAVI